MLCVTQDERILNRSVLSKNSRMIVVVALKPFINSFLPIEKGLASRRHPFDDGVQADDCSGYARPHQLIEGQPEWKIHDVFGEGHCNVSIIVAKESSRLARTGERESKGQGAFQGTVSVHPTFISKRLTCPNDC